MQANTTTSISSSQRIQSIDLLRGIVMILMVLDHVRIYFHYDAFYFNPLDISQTNPALFFTRFITHFCAPVFVFLAGTSAFFVGRKKSNKDLSIWLIKRGLWLVIAELTIIKLAWCFKLDYSVILLQVIWILGISMIVLAGCIHLPKYATLTICALFIFGHHLFETYTPQVEIFAIIWTFLYEFKMINIGGIDIFVGYQIIPWIFVMPLGYYLGELYSPTISKDKRITILRYIGVSALLLFALLRGINIYGDPSPWGYQEAWISTILSFFNLTKYPPSLLFLLFMIGIAMLFLSWAENWKGKISEHIVVIGRVPMFYYIIHLYAIHLLASVAAVLSGWNVSDMMIDVWVTMQPELKGYGFSLWVVYMIWVGMVLVLYPLCKWYDAYKRTHREKWWLSYL